MVPFQPHLSSLNHKRPSSAIREPLENFAKKKKWEPSPSPPPPPSSPPHNSTFDIELHLETPLPSDWQRCLDIQSGKIHFYNTTTHKRTSKDPRDKLDKHENEENEDTDTRLDLELNLTCESFNKNDNRITQGRRVAINGMFGSSENHNKQKEMVAAVCMRCHLLVMMSKSSPECPNCKFMNSPEHTSPAMFKRRCHLSW